MNLWAVSAANPRKKARKSRKARSPAQKAATARMLAANRSRGGGSKRAKSRRSTSVATRASSSVRRASRRVANVSMRNLGGSALELIKGGAVGAGGAIGVDLAMGFIGPMLPASFAAKLNADGTPNYMNYAAKGAVAMAVGILGAKVVKPSVARELAAGSFTVMAYELLRPLAVSMLPASMPLGYMSPGRVMNGGMARYDSTRLGRMGAYNNVTALNSPTLNGVGTMGRGAAAARRIG